MNLHEIVEAICIKHHVVPAAVEYHFLGAPKGGAEGVSNGNGAVLHATHGQLAIVVCMYEMQGCLQVRRIQGRRSAWLGTLQAHALLHSAHTHPWYLPHRTPLKP